MFAALADALVFGSVGFWVLFTVVSVWFWIALSLKKSFTATIVLVLTIFLLVQFGNLSFAYVWAHPGGALLWALTYLGAGALWSVMRWALLLLNMKRKHKDLRKKFLDHRALGSRETIPAYLKGQWHDTVRDSFSWEGVDVAEDGSLSANPGRHKESIYMWILFWPWSIAFYFLEEPLVRTVRFIYRRLVGTYEKISESVFSSTKETFVDPEPRKGSTRGGIEAEH